MSRYQPGRGVEDGTPGKRSKGRSWRREVWMCMTPSENSVQGRVTEVQGGREEARWGMKLRFGRFGTLFSTTREPCRFLSRRKTWSGLVRKTLCQFQGWIAGAQSRCRKWSVTQWITSQHFLVLGGNDMFCDIDLLFPTKCTQKSLSMCDHRQKTLWTFFGNLVHCWATASVFSWKNSKDKTVICIYHSFFF